MVGVYDNTRNRVPTQHLDAALVIMVMTPRVKSWRRYRPLGAATCIWWVLPASDAYPVVRSYVSLLSLLYGRNGAGAESPFECE